MIKSIKRAVAISILPLFLLLGSGLLLFGLIPGSLNLEDVAERLAARLSSDGSFEFTAPAYAAFQRASLWAGLTLLLLGLGHWFFRRRSRPVARAFSLGLALVAATGVFLGSNVVIARSNSILYRQLAGGPPTERPRPEATGTPAPTSTLALEGEGGWVEYAGDLEMPVALVTDGVHEGRYYVVQKVGRVSILDAGRRLEPAFLDITDRVLPKLESYEQGLLGMAFHPDYAENGHFFISYIDILGNLAISRFQVSADPQQGDAGSEEPLLGVFQPGPTHNGGTMLFGPDGYLYIGLGDGALQYETEGHSQSLDTLLGKIIRIDVDHGSPYAIPPDNPFAASYGMDEIWHFGLRNPWQFTFDPMRGDFYIADVGLDDREEIDFLPAGAGGGKNFGWDLFQGSLPMNTELQTAMPDRELVDPIWEYPKGGGNCAAMGGQVYHGDWFPSLRGTYLFGDFCSGVIWGLRRGPDGAWQHRTLWDTHMSITSFAVGWDRELYATDLNGKIWRLEP